MKTLIALIFFCLLPSLAGAEEIRIYDNKMNLRYRVEGNKIYDNRMRQVGSIERGRVYDQQMRQRYSMEDYGKKSGDRSWPQKRN